MTRLPGSTGDVTGNVLIVYAQLTHPLRSAVQDHLYAFRRHSKRRVFYLNLRVQDVPEHVLRRRYDMVVFHTSFLAHRWLPELFTEVCNRAAPLKRLSGVRVALPQDEFLRTNLVCDFIDDFDIDVVCSVAPESEWPKIYPTVDRTRVAFQRILTGYLDDRTVARIERVVDSTADRDIDVGYRAWRGAYWLGRHGTLKGTISDAVDAEGRERGLQVDVSTRDEDTLLGDDWFRFLSRCRYTIGIEGGASILDFDGAIKERTERYQAEHPSASFDEVEEACFPGEDGGLALFAISPRHLEACATRTCQILVEGEYNGVLEPGRHFIEIKPDLSDLARVLATLGDEQRRARIVQAAYDDVVASGRYSYRSMVDQIETAALGSAAAPAPRSAAQAIALALNRASDRLGWWRIAYRLKWAPRVGAFSPRRAVDRLRWSRQAAMVASIVPPRVKEGVYRILGARRS
jgi:hypothetical protein